MNIIQLIDNDGEIIGLFGYNQDKDPQPIIDECRRKAEMAMVEICSEEGEEESEYELFEQYLNDEGINRIFAIECQTDIF